MDLSKISPQKRAVLQRISDNERAGNFHVPVEDDPPAPELTPEKVDYLCKKVSSKIKRRIANFIGDRYFLKLIKKDIMIIDDVKGTEYLQALKNGAIITCNHFSPLDNYILFHGIRKYLPKKYLYKIIREGNYTNFPGLYGFLFRHCDTLPLSRNRRTMINFSSAVQTLLKRGESILVYPEQEMWFNYRKPRPFLVGGFKMAYRAGVPIVPAFITMENDETRVDSDGYPVQRHTLHILKPIYPDETLGEKAGAQKMCDTAYAYCKELYETVYGKPLVYGEDE